MNKTKNDARVVEHLEEIKKLLPTLDVWRDIYPNRIMRELVAEAYHHILDFSRAATEYLTRFRRMHSDSSPISTTSTLADLLRQTGRVYLAINPIATARFENTATAVHKTLAEINAVAMLGLHQTSQTIKQTVLSLEEKVSNAEVALVVAKEQAAKFHQELLEKSEQAERERQNLMLQNDELRSQIEQQKRESERQERQEDMRKLAAFKRLLGVSCL